LFIVVVVVVVVVVVIMVVVDHLLGAFGLVRKARLEDGKMVAIKSFSHSLLQSPRGTNDYAIFQEFRFESNLAAYVLIFPIFLRQLEFIFSYFQFS
jgi:hypothetical protein